MNPYTYHIILLGIQANILWFRDFPKIPIPGIVTVMVTMKIEGDEENEEEGDNNEEEGDDNEKDEEQITLVAIPADTSAAYKSLGENPAPQEAGSWFSSFPALEHASDIFHDDADDGDDIGDGGIGDLRIPLV